MSGPYAEYVRYKNIHIIISSSNIKSGELVYWHRR